MLIRRFANFGRSELPRIAVHLKCAGPHPNTPVAGDVIFLWANGTRIGDFPQISCVEIGFYELDVLAGKLTRKSRD